jgi:hypothetical protein
MLARFITGVVHDRKLHPRHHRICVAAVLYDSGRGEIASRLWRRAADPIVQKFANPAKHRLADAKDIPWLGI